MKKLPLLTALAAASLCTLASAQSVQVYGKLYPYLISEGGSGATPAGTAVSNLVPAATGVNAAGKIKGMSAGNSNLGFRGTEDLGGGLKAIFQIEGTIALDTGAPGFSWNRNTFVGLEGGFGTIRLGLMDTVLKEYGDTLGILGVSSGTPMSSSNVLRRPGFSTSGNSRFHERRPNSIRYDSPEVGGFGAALQVATNEASLTSNPILGAAKTYSMAVKYDNGPIYVALAYEIHTNWFGGSFGSPAALRNTNAADNVKSNDKALQGTVEWRITKQHKVEFDVIKKKYNEDAIVNGRFRTYENTAYMIAVDSRWDDKWRTAAHFVKASAGSCTRLNAACSADGLNGTKFLVGAAYYLSKRTYLFGLYDQITNGKSARFSNVDFTNPNPGEDIKHYIAGISHSF